MNKIVFVEDDPEVGTLIAAYLGKHDMDVVVEPRGDRAEEVIAREKPDLVLLDIMLPGKDGMTLCRDLRGQWQGPIVLLTSLDSDMNHILSLEMGASDYILKTTPPAVLLARLRLHLRQHIAPAAPDPVSPARSPPQRGRREARPPHPYHACRALGAMYAAQLMAAARRALPTLDRDIEEGDFSALFDWLRQNIWQHGSRFTTSQLIQQATGEDLNSRYFREHLTTRYL
ncbi:response regulator [Klebsiella pneumoniae]|nr:response regulator [Klebsiella pneumoniae]